MLLLAWDPFIEHIGVLHQYRLDGQQQLLQLLQYFKVLFPDFQPFLQANWRKCFPLVPSIHINIKHLQTAAACVWMQQCDEGQVAESRPEV